ncbi:FAD-dependent oxidoreductase [Nocardiopsis sp. YSL2]|uniref:FAD-dependent oxidoreductase n=1 Tax=Nocardiopsis sp. YSL2 TaxID=2939492 RepID=UPI0026F47665|nr:FAD-dependent oxidoreductase [Nocardiopsis sp. YSL2]
MAENRPGRSRVIVVGAGPVGLMLACELRLAGTEVVVLERRPEPTTESRASTLHARTMEILDDRGLADRLGTPPGDTRGHFGGVPLDLTLPSRYPGQWKVPQTRTEQVLQERAEELGATILRGYDVRAVDEADDRVVAEARAPSGRTKWFQSRVLVACDGQDSTIRRLVRADFPGHAARRELLRADVAGIDVRPRRFERLERGMVVAARRDDGVTRVMAHEFDAVAGDRTAPPGFDEIATVWRRLTGEHIGSGKPLWVNSFDDANRQVTGYRQGRVLFAGDAAHIQMPIGGQALNLGLQDAVNLGWKLPLYTSGRAGSDLLDTYQDERHAVGRRVLANIRAQAQLLLGGPEVEPLRELVTRLISLEDVRVHLAGMISGLDVRYDVGGLGPHPLGARLPDTVLAGDPKAAEAARAQLRRGRALLVDRTGARRGGPADAARPWSDLVTVVPALPEPAEGASGGKALLVRPDGHVAWVGGPDDDPGPSLRRWLGPSPHA